jgi:hypothetical protein
MWTGRFCYLAVFRLGFDLLFCTRSTELSQGHQSPKPTHASWSNGLQSNTMRLFNGTAHEHSSAKHSIDKHTLTNRA